MSDATPAENKSASQLAGDIHFRRDGNARSCTYGLVRQTSPTPAASEGECDCYRRADLGEKHLSSCPHATQPALPAPEGGGCDDVWAFEKRMFGVYATEGDVDAPAIAIFPSEEDADNYIEMALSFGHAPGCDMIVLATDVRAAYWNREGDHPEVSMLRHRPLAREVDLPAPEGGGWCEGPPKSSGLTEVEYSDGEKKVGWYDHSMLNIQTNDGKRWHADKAGGVLRHRPLGAVGEGRVTDLTDEIERLTDQEMANQRELISVRAQLAEAKEELVENSKNIEEWNKDARSFDAPLKATIAERESLRRERDLLSDVALCQHDRLVDSRIASREANARIAALEAQIAQQEGK